MIQIGKEHIDEIIIQAESGYPNECCGILIGHYNSDKSKTVKVIHPASNAREDENRHNRFLITPQEAMKAEVLARKNNMDVIGFYHSHPDHPAEPSAYDLEHAWTFYSYVIVSVNKGKHENVTSWKLHEDRNKFTEEPVIIGGK